ncbi:MAG: hypothetical protein Q9183_006807 [Haloplaca sp. 2 TL-2023]
MVLNIVSERIFTADQQFPVEQWTDITQSPTYESLPKAHDMTATLTSIYDRITQTVQHPLFHARTPLDGRSSTIRSRETNLGNLIADAVRAFYGADIAFVNSGGIRCDKIINPTDNTALTIKDMIDVLPFNNPFVVLRLRGSQILRALENSLSDAHTDGRFLQLSGLRIAASWARPEGHRLLSAHLSSSNPDHGSGALEPIASSSTYTVAMVSFIAEGFDGYSDLKEGERVVGEEGAMTDTDLMLGVLGYEKDGEKQRKGNDQTDSAVERARMAVVVGYHERDGLPMVGPVVDGRIDFKEWNNNR